VKFVRLSPELEAPFAVFLKRLLENGDEAFFSPHPFTDKEAKRLAHYQGKDYYCVALEESRVAGYGILRGWDEGYARPSLGIAVHPDERRKGHAEKIMAHLHDEARKRQAREVRLRVKKDNARAVALYKKLGYRMAEDKDPQYYEGILAL
jgi:ribosomal protein S18 acetylase RimI-like enzyme